MATRQKLYVYLYTRSKLKAPKKARLRVRVELEQKKLFAVLPILVCANYSDFYTSDGNLRDGYTAYSLEEKYLDKCIKLAYLAAVNAAKYLTSGKSKHFKCTSEDFSYLVSNEYEELTWERKDPESFISRLIKEDEQQN